MKGEDSIFSFIKRQEQPESAPARPVPPSLAPYSAPIPPPTPSENFTKLAARITELESKFGGQQAPVPAAQQRILSLERTVAQLQQVAEDAGREAHAAKEIAPGHDAVGALKAELQASQQRVAALERFVTELQKFTEAAGREAQAVKESGKQELAKFRGELEALRAKEDSAEALHRGLTEAAERSLKSFEAGVLGELKERLQALDAVSADITHKANLISATTAGNSHRIDKLEERAGGLKYLENRLEAADKKFEKLYELEAVVQAVKVGMESLENKFGVLARDTAGMAAEHQGIRSDFESTAHEVKQLSALFNYFRTELAFLLPKKKESVGNPR